MHAHDEAQLTFAVSGMMQVHTAAGRWLVPPQLAVWAPAGIPHQVDVLADAELWMIYWQPWVVHDWAPSKSLDRAFALRVTPLLQALLNAAFAADAMPEKVALIVRLVLHDLIETPDAPTFLPLPASAVGRRVADLAFADACNRLDVSELASRAATSSRTVSRLFPAETGLSFKAWRQHRRVLLRLPAGHEHDADRVLGWPAGHLTSLSGRAVEPTSSGFTAISAGNLRELRRAGVKLVSPKLCASTGAVRSRQSPLRPS